MAEAVGGPDQRQGVFVSGGTLSGPVIGVNYGTVNYYSLGVGPAGTRLGDGAPSPIRVLDTVRALPRAPRAFYDRADALVELAAELRPGGAAWLAGPLGCGLSALLRTVASLPDAPQPHGAIYLDGAAEPPSRDEILRRLYLFYHAADAPIAVTPQAAQAFLAERRALFVLDRLPLGPADLLALADALGQGAVLVAAEGRAPDSLADVALGPLPPADALRLLADAAGPAGGDTAALGRLCAGLAGVPMALTLAGRLLRAGAAPPAQLAAVLAERLARAAPADREPLLLAAGLALEALDDDQRAVLAALAQAPELTLDALSAVSQRPADRVEPAMQRLNLLGLALAGGERYQLAGASLRRALARLLPAGGERRRAAAFFLAGATGPRLDDLSWLRAEQANLFDAIRALIDAGQPAAAGQLAQSLNPALVLDGAWGAWGRLIDLAQEAATAADSPALRAWAFHERGTRAGLQGDLAAAAEDLDAARRLRQTLGDRAGLDLTLHNLRYLGLLPPPPPRSARRVWPALLLGALLLGAIGAIGGRAVLQPSGPTATPALATATRAAPTSGPLAASTAVPTLAATPAPAATARPTATPTARPTATARPFALRPFVGRTAAGAPLPIAVQTLLDDPDRALGPASLAVAVPPLGGALAIDPAALALVYTPKLGFVGVDSFSYTICDAAGRCATGEAAVQVAGRPILARPIGLDAQVGLAPDDSAQTIALPNAGLADTVGYSWEYADTPPAGSGFVLSGPPDGAVAFDNNQIIYTAEAGASGADYFSMAFQRSVFRRGAPFYREAALYLGPFVAADAPPPAPLLIDVAQYVDDPDGQLDLATLAVDSAGARGTARASARGSISYTPPDSPGEDRFSYTVCDRAGGCSSAEVTVEIGVDSQPLARYQGYTYDWSSCGFGPVNIFLGLDPRSPAAPVVAQLRETATGGEALSSDWYSFQLQLQDGQPGQYATSVELGRLPRDERLQALLASGGASGFRVELRFALGDAGEMLTPPMRLIYNQGSCE